MEDYTLDEQVDPVSEGIEGLTEPDEMDMASDRADREVGESQTESTEEEDLSGEKFAYTLDDGTEIQGTVQEIAQALAKSEKETLASENAELQAKLQELQGKPSQDKTQEGQEQLDIKPVEWNVVGEVLETMLQGGDPERGIGGIESIGPAIQDMQFRDFLTNPRYAAVITAAVEGILENREGRSKEEAAFREQVGAEFKDAEIMAFHKANPHLKTRNEVVMGMQLNAMRQEVENIKTGKGQAVKDAEKKAAAQTVKDLKAKGQLRRLSASGRTNLGGETKTPYNPQDPRDREKKWAERLSKAL